MADERTRLRRQLGLTPEPTPVTSPTRLAAEESGAIGAASIASRMTPITVTPTAQPDEQTRIAITEPVKTLTPTGAQRAAGTIAQRNQRFEEELARREATKPTEDPGPGFAWIYSVSEGRWKKVRTTFGGTGGDGGTGGGNDGGGGTGGGTGGTTETPTIS